MEKIKEESQNVNLAWLVFGKLVNVMCLFLLLRTSTFILSSEELGRFYLFSSFVSLFFLVFVSPVGQYFFRMSNRWFIDGCFLSALDKYGYYILCVSIFTVPAAYALSGILGLDEEFSSLSVVLMSCTYVLTYAWFYTVIPIMNMLHMRVIYAMFYIVSSLLMLVLPVLFIYYIEPTANCWLAGTIAAMGCIALLAGRSLRYRIQVHNEVECIVDDQAIVNFREAADFVFPVLWVTLFTWVQVYGFRVSLENSFGVEYLAYLGLGLIVGSQILSIVESVGTQFFYPIFYRHIEQCSRSEMKVSVSFLVNSLLPIYFLCAVYISYFSKEIFWLISSEKYLEWHWVLSISVWGEFFRLSGNLLSNVAHAVKDTRSLIFSHAAGAIFLIVGVYFSALWPGHLSFVVWVYFFGMMLFALLMYYSMNKLMVIVFPRRLYVVVLLLSLPFFVMGCVTTFDVSIEKRLLLAFTCGIYIAGACLYVALNWARVDDSC